MKELLPECERNEITTGAAGNPVLRLGSRLKGATAFAEQRPRKESVDFLFAMETFVSSDSPLESKRFADAEIGKGL